MTGARRCRRRKAPTRDDDDDGGELLVVSPHGIDDKYVQMAANLQILVASTHVGNRGYYTGPTHDGYWSRIDYRTNVK